MLFRGALGVNCHIRTEKRADKAISTEGVQEEILHIRIIFSTFKYKVQSLEKKGHIGQIVSPSKALNQEGIW